jgi:hypothetical protein
MKPRVLFASLIILAAVAAHGQSLTGTWKCNDGGTYSIRQDGNELWWFGRSATGASFTNVFHGTIRRDVIEGTWADVPPGSARHSGQLNLQIRSGNQIVRTLQTGTFSGSEWTREDEGAERNPSDRGDRGNRGDEGTRRNPPDRGDDGTRRNPQDRNPQDGDTRGTLTNRRPNEYRGQNGLRLSYECPPNPSGPVYGTDIYTDDSNVCAAAVHAGVMNRNGGRVTIEIRPGRDSYQGTLRHGINTSSYARWPGSYVFAGGEAPEREPQRVDAETSPAEYRGQDGQRLIYDCPPDARGRVFGTDIYTDDSDVCAAAVHAGVIRRRGGTVTIEIRPGRSSYNGSSRNGITSSGYGSWNGSFVFPQE